MGIRQTLARKLVLADDPHAFDEGTLLGDLERQQARIASDPATQRRRAEARAETNRELLPVKIVVLIINAVLWGAIAWYLSPMITPIAAVIALVLTSAFVWRLATPRA